MAEDISKPKYFIVDRIEDDVIALEDEERNILFIKKEDIKGNINEGDVLYKYENRYIRDEEETIKRKNKINELMKGLWVD